MVTANKNVKGQKKVVLRMQSYLGFFNLQDACTRLQSVGLTNLDAISHDWYQGTTEDEDIEQRKLAYRQRMNQVLNRHEFLAITYLLQFYEWDASLIRIAQGEV